MAITKKQLLVWQQAWLQYIRRVLHPQKYVTLKTLCEFAGIDVQSLSPAVRRNLGKRVWQLCYEGMPVTPKNGLWWAWSEWGADSAMNHKALAIITRKQIKDYPCIVTENPGATAAKICLYYRLLNKDLTIAAVAGSIGKTTTSGMLASVYANYTNTFFSPAGGNELFEIVYALQHIPSKSKKMVQEICENWKNGTQYSAIATAPSIAVITTIDNSHIGSFGSIDNIAAEICTVVRGLPSEGPVVITKDEFRWQSMLENHPVITVSDHDTSADYYAKDIQVLPQGLSFTVVDNAKHSEHKVNLNNIYARHNIKAALRAFAVGCHDNIPYATIIEGLAKYRTSGVRQNILWTEDKICLYADCYNAIASSVKSAVEGAELIPITGQRIAVLGDIRGLGELSEKEHSECIDIINQSSFSTLITVGEEINAAVTRNLIREGLKVYQCNDKTEVEKHLKDMVKPGDLVLFKSSHDGQLATIIKHLWPKAYKKSNDYNVDYQKWRIKTAMS